MPAKKVKRKYVRKAILSPMVITEESGDKIRDLPIVEVKKKYLECPFCHNIQYQQLGRDETSSWCSLCGKCFSAFWKETAV